MDESVILKRESPGEKSNYLSKVFFFWLFKLYLKYKKNGIKSEQDLFVLSEESCSVIASKKLRQFWNKQLEKSKPSFLRAIIDTFRRELILSQLGRLFCTCISRWSQPWIILKLLTAFQGYSVDLDQAYFYGSCLVVIGFVSCLLNHHLHDSAEKIGLRMKAAMSSLIYQKVLKLDLKATEKTGGKLINLLAGDLNKMANALPHLFGLMIAPVEILLINLFIWYTAGMSVFSGLLPFIFYILIIQCFVTNYMDVMFSKVAMKTDFRVKLMKEIITGIQIIKLYAWEKPFSDKVTRARTEELDMFKSLMSVKGYCMNCALFMQRLATYCALIYFVYSQHEVLSPNVVFFLVQAYNILQTTVSASYFLGVSHLKETLVTIRRVQECLLLPEKIDTESVQSESPVVLSQVHATWNNEPFLKDITIRVPKGCLCAIIGPVGSGKSTIFQLILKELLPLNGTLVIDGNISYCSQTPWLFTSTIRNNILFGEEYVKERYDEVLQVCALEEDFQEFPHGDLSRVGERGVTLSGGQKARINMARAVYNNSEIYLLDDPLSAVDAHVGKQLFDKCIVGYLEGKTRILITHQTQYLQDVDLIIVINNGGIEAQGTYEELASSDLDFTKVLNAQPTDKKEKREEQPQLTSSRNVSKVTLSEVNSEENTKKSSPLKMYLSRASARRLIALLITIILLHGFGLCADMWLAIWTKDRMAPNQNSTIPTSRNLLSGLVGNFNFETSENVSVYIYSFLICGTILWAFVESKVLSTVTMATADKLHGQMFQGLVNTSKRFFDLNTSGKIVNRFSSDMSVVDSKMPRQIFIITNLLSLNICVLLVLMSTKYYMIPIILIICWHFRNLQLWYIKSTKDVNHLGAKTRSPIFSYVNNTMNGIVTVRASRKQEILRKEFNRLLDINTSAHIILSLTKNAFGIWTELSCWFLIALVIYGLIALNQYQSINASFIGLCLTQLLRASLLLQFVLFQINEVLHDFVNVERIVEYSKLQSEHSIANLPCPETWPEEGGIEFRNVSLRYSPSDPYVLRNINIYIKPGSKIGIVGRTGAGKSSLVTALFRFAPIEGTVLIDSLDTNTLDLRDLRRNISILPQDPVLFAASIRYNLDPLGEFKDEDLMLALSEVELKEIPNLDYEVSEGGNNFSLGERQLLCLARTILRKNKILILDEATANVDLITDTLIQTTVKKKFRNTTVLTIAHRLNTIMDSDKILVMDNGRVVEFDHPHLLLENPNGFFTKLVHESGSGVAQQLKNLSEESYAKSTE